MSIISNEHRSGSPFNCPGCFRARGECECPPRPEHQPGSPGVDLDELDAAFKVSTLDPRPSAQGRWMTAVAGTWPAISAELRTLRARVGELDGVRNARPIQDWHEDIGPVLWWTWPTVEPPYVGTPLDDDFPDNVTRWTQLVVPTQPEDE